MKDFTKLKESRWLAVSALVTVIVVGLAYLGWSVHQDRVEAAFNRGVERGVVTVFNIAIQKGSVVLTTPEGQVFELLLKGSENNETDDANFKP